MNKISKQLLKIAREVKALDEEGDGSGFQFYHDQENNEQERLDMAQKQGKKYILHHKEGNLWRIQACKDFRNYNVSSKLFRLQYVISEIPYDFKRICSRKSCSNNEFSEKRYCSMT